VGVYLVKKHTSLKYKNYFARCSDDIVPSIVPPPSRHPMRLLHVLLPIVPPALPIAAWVALRVSYSQWAVPRVCLS
jgi:hypothetical protein